MLGPEQGGPTPEEFKNIREEADDEDEALVELMEADADEEGEEEEDSELGTGESARIENNKGF